LIATTVRYKDIFCSYAACRILKSAIFEKCFECNKKMFKISEHICSVLVELFLFHQYIMENNMEKSKKSWIPPELNILLKAQPGEMLLVQCDQPGSYEPGSKGDFLTGCSKLQDPGPPIITVCLYDHA